MTATPTDRSRWLALVVLCAGMLMIILDQTIVNVALPTIQSDLGFSQSSLAWVVNAYLIALRRPAAAGRAASATCSAASGSSSPAWRSSRSRRCCAAPRRPGDAGRRALRPGRRRRDDLRGHPRHDRDDVPASRASRRRRSAIYSFVASAGASIGLLAGGLLTQAINWHWIFFVNLPIGVAAAVLAVRLLETDRGLGLGEGADVAGAALVTAALMLGVYTIVGTVDHGWGSAHTLGFGAAAVALLGGLRRAPGDREPPAGAAAHLPLAQRLGRQPGPGADGGRACSGCSSWAPSTCSACSATTPCRPARPSCPCRWASARCRSASPRG